MKIKIILSQIMLLVGVLAFSQPTTVYTCKGGSISANIYPEFSQAQITSANNQTTSQYGYLGITFLDNSSAQYNCHSYAWHLREGNTNKVWINNTSQQIGSCYDQTNNIDKYWTDGCFIKVCNEADADKLHYFCGNHSAVKSTTNPGFYESKWGQLAVVRHTKTGVPYADPVNSVNYYASTKVSGITTYLCSGNRTFSVKSISGATYSWTYSSTLVVVGSINTNQITVQRNGSSNGNAWVSVQISTPCSSSPVSNRQDFTVGNPDIPVGTTYVTSNYYYTSQLQIITPQVWFMPAGQTGYVTYNITDPTFTPTSWSTISGNTPIVSTDKRTIQFSISSGQTASYQLTAQGPCGIYTKNFGATVLLRSYFSITPTPNPASDNLRIKIADESLEAKALSTNENVSISLYEFTSNNIVKKWNFKNNINLFSLNVSNLKKGNYIIVVKKGNFKESKHILIEK